MAFCFFSAAGVPAGRFGLREDAKEAPKELGSAPKPAKAAPAKAAVDGQILFIATLFVAIAFGAGYGAGRGIERSIWKDWVDVMDRSCKISGTTMRDYDGSHMDTDETCKFFVGIFSE